MVERGVRCVGGLRRGGGPAAASIAAERDAVVEGLRLVVDGDGVDGEGGVGAAAAVAGGATAVATVQSVAAMMVAATTTGTETTRTIRSRCESG